MAEESALLDDLRYRITSPYLRGHGLEIGAGLSPQPLPEGVTMELFDLRNAEELAKFFDAADQDVPRVLPVSRIRDRFPDGAGFLIAHHVIEHCPNPVATLIEWSSYVKDNGVVVISMPAAESCSDDGRLIAPPDHVLDDYLFDRGRDSFESREHAYSCVAGWMNDQRWDEYLPLRKKEASEKAHADAHDKNLDTHWHALTLDLFEKIFRFASHFSPRAFSLVRVAHPHGEGEDRTGGDIFYVYRVQPVDAAGPDRAEEYREIEDSLDVAGRRLQVAQARLDGREVTVKPATPELIGPPVKPPGLGRYTAIEKYCRALTDFDETGLKAAFEEMEGEFGTFPPEPEPRTTRGRIGHWIVRQQAKLLWWLLRALRIRDSVLERIYHTLGRQLEAMIGYQAETHKAIRELNERLAALEARTAAGEGSHDRRPAPRGSSETGSC